MNQRAKELAERLTTFNNDMISFVENCPDDVWQKVTSGEQWPVGLWPITLPQDITAY